MPDGKRVVSYFYDSNVGNYHYGPGHPMKPHRIRMTHSLVMAYGMYKHMSIFRPRPATQDEMTQFHSDDYIDFLAKITPDTLDNAARSSSKFNVGEDCPVFDGMFDYSAMSAGGSMEGAARLNREKCDVAINWSGGLHHAKKTEASGFCYVNDIVLAILELLRVHQRVLYVDIDIHHGDGVEEAFYITDRVMTVSFHKYGEYFPGTGDIRDVGVGKGRYYAVNVPMRDGMDDRTFKQIFEPVIDRVIQLYRPEAIVLQCGADSLSGDRLGCFNLSMEGHADCLRFVRGYNIPLLVLGGGGYTIKNVSRTWANETAVAVDKVLDKEIPACDYYEYFGPDHILSVEPSNMENLNTSVYLDKIRTRVLQNLSNLAPAPSVPMQVVPDSILGDVDMDEDEDSAQAMDSRFSQRQLDEAVENDAEYYSDDESGERYARSLRHKLIRDEQGRDAGETDQDPSAAAGHDSEPTDDLSSGDGLESSDDADADMDDDTKLGGKESRATVQAADDPDTAGPEARRGASTKLEPGPTPGEELRPRSSSPPPLPDAETASRRHSSRRAQSSMGRQSQDLNGRSHSPEHHRRRQRLLDSYGLAARISSDWPSEASTSRTSLHHVSESPPRWQGHASSSSHSHSHASRAKRRASDSVAHHMLDDPLDDFGGAEFFSRAFRPKRSKSEGGHGSGRVHHAGRVAELRGHRRRRRARSSSSDSSLDKDTSSTTSVEELRSLHKSMNIDGPL